ncbi:DUF952 domain-containing protein [Actinocorallia lasiicapitis]
MSHILHVADRSTWEQVTDVTPYAMSTRDTTLEQEGFIHCCATEQQLEGVLSRYYQGAEDLVVLVIDPRHLDVRFEPSGDDVFPHIYSPLPKSSVIEVRPLPNTR